MKAKILSRDPLTGVTQWFEAHPDGGFTLASRQDVTALCHDNRELYNSTGEHAPWPDGFARVASIPLVLYEDLRRTGVLSDWPSLRRWLNDPDNRHFRTRPGKL